MISLLYPIVTLFIIKTIINKSLKLCGFNFVLILTHVVNVIKLINFSLLKLSQILIRNNLLLCKSWGYWVLNFLFREIISSQLISFWSFWNYRVYSLNHLSTCWHLKCITWLLLLVLSREEIFIWMFHSTIYSVVKRLLIICLILNPPMTSLCFGRSNFELLLSHSWYWSCIVIAWLNCSLVIALTVKILLALNSTRSTHLTRRLVNNVSNSCLLCHLLFILVENVSLVIFVALFEHEFLCWACSNLGRILIVLDKHGWIYMVIICKISCTKTRCNTLTLKIHS